MASGLLRAVGQSHYSGTGYFWEEIVPFVKTGDFTSIVLGSNLITGFLYLAIAIPLSPESQWDFQDSHRDCLPINSDPSQKAVESSVEPATDLDLWCPGTAPQRHGYCKQFIASSKLEIEIEVFLNTHRTQEHAVFPWQPIAKHKQYLLACWRRQKRWCHQRSRCSPGVGGRKPACWRPLSWGLSGRWSGP